MSAPTNPGFDLAHLGHVEMLTDRFDESLDFFTRVYGLKLSGLDADSAYLRAWDDYEHCTLKLTRAGTTGVGHIAYRAASPEALERRVAAIKASGYKTHGWIEGDQSHGRAFRFEDPFGHVFELYWDTVKYQAPPEDASALKNLSSRFPSAGIGPRRISLAAHGGQRVVSLQRQIPGVRERLGLQRQCHETQQERPHHEVTPVCSRLRQA